MFIVPKKLVSHGQRKWRIVLNFRKLNQKAIGDSYPLLNIIDILDQLRKARYFSIFDLGTRFHHIPKDPKDSLETIFSTSDGHYKFDRMPFDLKNAPATSQTHGYGIKIITRDKALCLFGWYCFICVYIRRTWRKIWWAYCKILYFTLISKL